MSTGFDRDDHGIIAAMQANWSFQDRLHVVYKQHENHGRRYLNKDEHLKQPGVAQQVSRLLADGIKKGSIIIAPETSSEVNLGRMVAELSESTLVPTKKVSDIHTFEEKVLPLLQIGGAIIGVDDIYNNGRTLREIKEALEQHGLTLAEFRVMADRNPEWSSGISDLQFIALATIQMEQWHESAVPADLKDQAITTKLGNGRRWTRKAGSPDLSAEMYEQRMKKENLGFHFDDGLKVVQMHIADYALVPKSL